MKTYLKHVLKNWIKLGQQEKLNYKLIKLLTVSIIDYD